MDKSIQIMLLEDNPADAELIRRELRKAGLDFIAHWARDKPGFLAVLDQFAPDLLLLDYSVPGFDGLTAMSLARQRFADVPAIIVSGAIGEETAIETLKAGATDYVLKDRLGRLGPVTRRALQEAEQLKEKKQAEAKLLQAMEELELRVAKRTEELRHYAAQLEWRNRELQDFASVASHDLQEPLRKIQIFGDLLARDLKDSMPEAARFYLSRMTHAAGRMQELIRALLVHARASTATAPFVRVELRRVVAEVISGFEEAVNRSGATFEIDHLPTIDGDPVQMIQLFQNLIGNAIKYARREQPPIVKISGREIPPRAGQPGGRCEIRVQDNGIGFNIKYLDRIFRPFQRLHGQPEYEGTGMGLAICRSIVERHGGTITAQSQPGEGSVFILDLPMEQAHDQQQQAS